MSLYSQIYEVSSLPDSSKSMRTSEEGSGQDEGPLWCVFSVNDRLGCLVVLLRQRSITMSDPVATYEKHAIDIVNITVLPSAVMNRVLWYSDLWTIEDRWLRLSVWSQSGWTGLQWVG